MSDKINKSNQFYFATKSGTSDSSGLIGINESDAVPVVAYIIQPNSSAQRRVMLQNNPATGVYFANTGINNTNVSVKVLYMRT